MCQPSDGHGQRVCNFLHDGLRLILLADAKDFRSQFQSAIQHCHVTPFVDFRRRHTQQTAPDGWYCRLHIHCNDENRESQWTKTAKCNKMIKFVVKIVTICCESAVFLCSLTIRRFLRCSQAANPFAKKGVLSDKHKAPEAFASGASLVTGYTDIQLGSALAIASTISFALSSPQYSRMSEARSRPTWMGPLNSVMLLYPFRQISAAVPHN